MFPNETWATINLKSNLCQGALLAEAPCPPQMRISLPRLDLLGEKRWPISQKEKDQEPFPQWAFIGFNLHRNTGKAHQSLSGSKDQIIDNEQRILRAYSELGSVS